MKTFGVIVLLALVYTSSNAKSLPDEASVVSVYTTQPTTSGNELDVYQQIANNLAERISSPIYRFFGYEKNKTEGHSTKKPWERIELLDNPDEKKTRQNEIEDRDVEELSVEALSKTKGKPEKVTLYNSYLPVNEHLENESNDTTVNEVNTDDDIDDITLDDVDPSENGREGTFVFILEWLGSLLQLAWGAISAIFTPSNGQKDE